MSERRQLLNRAMANLDPTFPTILMTAVRMLTGHPGAKASLIADRPYAWRQVRLLFIGPLVQLPTKLGQKYDQGLFAVDDNTTLAISRGIGESGVRARPVAAADYGVAPDAGMLSRRRCERMGFRRVNKVWRVKWVLRVRRVNPMV